MKRTLIAALLLAVSATAVAAPKHGSEHDPKLNPKHDKDINHCLEDAANRRWADLARQHHDSDTWQRLFGLRIGLCAMVARDWIELDRATRIFERERARTLREMKRKRRQGGRDGLGDT